MGIKGAKGLMRVSVLSLLLAAPAYAQDSDDDTDTSTSSAKTSADSSSDPNADLDRRLSDRASASERDDADLDRPAVLRDDNKAPAKGKPGLRVRLLDIDSELDKDNDDTDRGDNIDRNGVDDEDKPKAKDKQKQDGAKKDASKQDANKKDAPKDDAKKAAPAKDASSKKPGDCVDVKSEARFSGVGYDHLVTLKSACKKRLKCVVRTNVNSEPANVTLDPGEEESVLTWRGSPAREFTPDVKCD